MGDLIISNLRRKAYLEDLKRKRNTEDKSSLYNRTINTILSDREESTRNFFDKKIK